MSIRNRKLLCLVCGCESAKEHCFDCEPLVLSDAEIEQIRILHREQVEQEGKPSPVTYALMLKCLALIEEIRP